MTIRVKDQLLPMNLSVAALFTKKEGISGIERMALSFGLGIALMPLIGLLLNPVPWRGIGTETALYSAAVLILMGSVIAWLRPGRLLELEQPGIESPVRRQGWGGGSWDRRLSIVLGLIILGVLGALIYAIASPKVGERVTEFYIEGLEGKAVDYPEDLVVGEEGKVIVGIINREGETVTYRVEIAIDGVKHNEVGPVELDHDGKWEQVTGFTPGSAGDDQLVEFLLYRQGQEDVYRRLHLWVDVR